MRACCRGWGVTARPWRRFAMRVESSAASSTCWFLLITPRTSAADQHLDLRPGAIREALALQRPVYSRTAVYWHFGRDEPVFTWENTDPCAASEAWPVSKPPASLALVATRVATRVVDSLGGRYSAQLGIDVDQGDDQVERWALAATLFGARISAKIAERTFAVLEQAGVHSIADAGRRDTGRLIALLDAGGYARYDFRTAERLHAIARRLETEYGGRVSAVLGLPADQLWAALDALPGWGEVTVGLFLRELRGVRPGIDLPLDRRALHAASHLGLLAGGGPGIALLRDVAHEAHHDVRDLEAALVRLSLLHGRHMAECPGGMRCSALTRTAAQPDR